MSLEISSTFFTELAGITQTAGESFGPQGPTATDKENNFRITTSFTATGFKKAFAVCKGKVLVQPQTADNSKVNLLLQPLKQPANRLPIKYFIYRGLNKSSFFDSTLINGETQLITNGNKASASTLVQNLWSQFISFNGLASNTTDPFLSKWLGYDPVNQVSTESISSYLRKRSTDDLSDVTNPNDLFELPVVSEGDWIGDFSQSFGFEVVLDFGVDQMRGIGRAFDLDFLQQSSYVHEMINLSPGESSDEYRAFVHNFIDPSAFYGSHVLEGELKTIDANLTDTVISGASIYSSVLSIFENRNTYYLLIDNNQARCYNYNSELILPSALNNEDFRTSVDGLTFNDHTYKTNLWPIHIGNSTQQNSSDRNVLYVRLIAAKDLQIGYLRFGWLETNDDRDRFIFSEVDHEDNTLLSSPFRLYFPNAVSGSDKISLSSLSWVTINQSPNVLEDTVSGAANSIKEMDNLISIRSSSLKNETSSYPVISQENSNELLVCNIFGYETPVVVQQLTVFDIIVDPNNSSQLRERVTYQLNIQDASQLSANVLPDNSSLQSKRTIFDSALNNYYDISRESGLLRVRDMTINQDTVTSLQVYTLGENHFPGALTIGLTKNENDQILSEAASLGVVNPKLYLKRATPESGTSANFIKYYRYEVEVFEATFDGDIRFHPLSSVVELFTLDKVTYFTKDYSDFVVENSFGDVSIESVIG